MFINYLWNIARPTAFNLFVARVIVSFYALWKLLSYEYERLAEWPQFLYEQHWNIFPWFMDLQLRFVVVEKWIAAVLFLFYLVGYRLGLTCFALVTLLTHMGALHYTVTNSGATWLLVIYLLALHGIYRESDVMSVDGFTRGRKKTQTALNAELESAERTPVTMSLLRWTLVILAASYFFTGYSKLLVAGLSWADAEHLPIMIHRDALMLHNDFYPAGRFLVDHTWLAAISSWLTLALECGFLLAVLARLPLWPFFFGLAGLHTMILLTMGIFFFDQYIFFLLFLPWDKLYSAATAKQPLQVFYDDQCYFCARALTLVRHADTAGRVQFVGSSKAPSVVDLRPEVDLNAAMYALEDGRWYRGYYAFREVLRANYVLRPVVWLMALPPVAWLGERVYAYIAKNRKTLTVCSIEPVKK